MSNEKKSALASWLDSHEAAIATIVASGFVPWVAWFSDQATLKATIGMSLAAALTAWKTYTMQSPKDRAEATMQNSAPQQMPE